jgi:hypothetical protein
MAVLKVPPSTTVTSSRIEMGMFVIQYIRFLLQPQAYLESFFLNFTVNKKSDAMAALFV